MTTWKAVVSDIMLLLKQVIDDKEIPYDQVYYWTIITADRLLMLHNVKRLSGAFITRYQVDVLTNAQEELYVPLPHKIYDLDMDAAVEDLAYYDPEECGDDWLRVQFFRTDRSTLRSRAKHPDEKPAPMRPYFYRQGPNLFLVGPRKSIEHVEMSLMITLPDIQSVNPDAEIDFPAELLGILQKHVLDLGRWTLAAKETKVVNDGNEREPSRTLPQLGKVTSVNDPVNDMNNGG